MEGSAANFLGVNVRAPTIEQKGDGKAGRKASGMLMVDGVLYLLARNAGNSQLAWSEDHGRTWTWSTWKFTSSFGCPTFLNFGPNYSSARDGFVYIYSPDSDSAYVPADRMVLARARKDQIRERAAYEFLKTIGKDFVIWSSEIRERSAVFFSKGQCYRSNISYDAPLKRYLWCQTLAAADPRFKGGMGIFDAPQPWGPWTTVFYTQEW